MANVPPRVVIDPEEDAVRITGQGCCIVLVGLDAMRDVRDALSNHIALLEAEQRDTRAPVLNAMHRDGRDGRVRWIAANSGPDYRVEVGE